MRRVRFEPPGSWERGDADRTMATRSPSPPPPQRDDNDETAPLREQDSDVMSLPDTCCEVAQRPAPRADPPAWLAASALACAGLALGAFCLWVAQPRGAAAAAEPGDTTVVVLPRMSAADHTAAAVAHAWRWTLLHRASEQTLIIHHWHPEHAVTTTAAPALAHLTRTEAWKGGALQYVLWDEEERHYLRARLDAAHGWTCVGGETPWQESQTRAFDWDLEDGALRLDPQEWTLMEGRALVAVPRAALVPPADCTPSETPFECVELPDYNATDGGDALLQAEVLALQLYGRHHQWQSALNTTLLWQALNQTVFDVNTQQFVASPPPPVPTARLTPWLNLPVRGRGYVQPLWRDCQGEVLCEQMQQCLNRTREPLCPWSYRNGTKIQRLSCECVRLTHLALAAQPELLGHTCGLCAQAGDEEGCGCWARWMVRLALLQQQPCVQRQRCSGPPLVVPCAGSKPNEVRACVVRSSVPCVVGAAALQQLGDLSPDAPWLV